MLPLDTGQVRIFNVGFLSWYCGWSRAEGYVLDRVTRRLKKWDFYERSGFIIRIFLA